MVYACFVYTRKQLFFLFLFFHFSFSYTWKGENYELISGDIALDATVMSEYGESDYGESQLVSLTVRVERDTVGFGSDNRIIATVTNTQLFFIAEDVHLTVPNELHLITNETYHLFLAPDETKKVSWVVHVPELSSQYKYTFPASVFTMRQKPVLLQFAAMRDGSRYTIQEEKTENKKTEKTAAEPTIPLHIVNVTNITVPLLVADGEQFTVSFVLQKEAAFPLNVTV